MMEAMDTGPMQSSAGSHLPPRLLRRAIVLTVPTIFLLRFAYFVQLDAAEGRSTFLTHRLFNESTGALLAIIPMAFLGWLALRVPLARPVRPRLVATYVLAFIAGTLCHTTLMVVVRAILAPRFGWTEYGLDLTPARFGYEAATNLVFYITGLALLALGESVARQRDRERRSAELERSLLHAELSNLRLQLQPHFLFNALNTISSTMYEDVDAADRLLDRLASLLRASLLTTHVQEVALGDELAVLGQYLDLMHARFGDALVVSIQVPEELLAMTVPSFVLQPLVENAMRHGGIARLGHGAVVVAAEQRGAMLVLRVHDDGPGAKTASVSGGDESSRGVLATGATEPGIGLSTTAKRLRYLYGDQQWFHAGPVATGGFEVELRIPARRMKSAVVNARSATTAPTAALARR